jgi:hypothetical protein
MPQGSLALDASQQVHSHACPGMLPSGEQQPGTVSSASPDDADCAWACTGKVLLLRGARCARFAAAPPAPHGTCTAPCARRASALGAQLWLLCSLCGRLRHAPRSSATGALAHIGHHRAALQAHWLTSGTKGAALQAHWLTSGTTEQRRMRTGSYRAPWEQRCTLTGAHRALQLADGEEEGAAKG